MTIPPVSVRQIRGCGSCVFNSDSPCFVSHKVRTERWEGTKDESIIGDRFLPLEVRWEIAAEKIPCTSHFTINEMQKLIDHHNTIEIQYRELILDLMQYVNNPFLGIIQNSCELLGHPVDIDDNYKNLWNRCYCRQKKYDQISLEPSCQ